jgi:tRNA A-37 threonylcarbamoyl transferase component Bud32/tetratricopeptide (TPR) repeat protein
VSARCLDDVTVLQLVDGQLAAGALAVADAHLDGCTSCRDVVAQVARTRATETGVLARGQVVGRYVVGDVVGAGAMGRVYSAWEPELDRRVALKVLHDDVATTSARGRVLREAQAMAKLAHPNVVTVHEVGTVGESVFVAMELVDGETLRAWAKDRPWREVAATLLEVARGLAAVHAAGVVHRDIKPDNIIVGADGRARLGDFGLARSDAVSAPAPASVPVSVASTVPALDATATGVVAGTPAYMAPQLLGGGAADAASDQFSFGVTAWELLHGERPFAGQTWAALAVATSTGAPRSPRARIPGWLDALVRRCIAADPERRFPSMRAVADALTAGLAARRRPLVMAAGIAAVAVTAVVAVAVVLRRPEPAAACSGIPAEVAALRAGLPAGASAPAVTALDRWTARWAETRRAVCRATDAPPARLATQERCLDHRAAEVRALLDRRARAVGERAASPDDRLIDALAALPPPDECRALAAGAADPVPADPARAAAVRAVDTGLPALRAATAFGDARGALAELAALVARARDSGHAPTLAAALLAQAEALRTAGELEAAATAARDAVVAAERGHDDGASAAAWIERMVIAGERRELDAADELGALAEGAIARAGDAAHDIARLLHLRGQVAFNRGKLADAGALLVQARERQVALGADSIEVARIDAALGHVAREAGRLDDALAHFQSALAVDRAVRGPTHPALAGDLHNIAGVLRRKGDLEAALATYREALAIDEATAGAESAAAGLTHNSIGLVLMKRGEWAAARAELERARAILDAWHHADRAMAEHNLGLVSQATADHRGALTKFATAAAIYADTIGHHAPPAVRLLLDRAASERALGDRAAARALAEEARAAAAQLDGAEWITTDADALLAALGAPPSPSPSPSPRPRPPITTPPVEPQPVEPTAAPPDAAPAPPPDAAPLPRDIGVYGGAQKW